MEGGAGFWDYWWFQLPNYLLGLLMWICFGRFLLGFFVRPDSRNYIWRSFRWFTDPVIRWLEPVTPSFLVDAFKPLYAAFWIIVIRVLLWILLFNLGLAPTLADYGVTR